jgi:hypothetical protein
MIHLAELINAGKTHLLERPLPVVSGIVGDSLVLHRNKSHLKINCKTLECVVPPGPDWSTNTYMLLKMSSNSLTKLTFDSENPDIQSDIYKFDGPSALKLKELRLVYRGRASRFPIVCFMKSLKVLHLTSYNFPPIANTFMSTSHTVEELKLSMPRSSDLTIKSEYIDRFENFETFVGDCASSFEMLKKLEFDLELTEKEEENLPTIRIEEFQFSKLEYINTGGLTLDAESGHNLKTIRTNSDAKIMVDSENTTASNIELEFEAEKWLRKTTNELSDLVWNVFYQPWKKVTIILPEALSIKKDLVIHPIFANYAVKFE